MFVLAKDNFVFYGPNKWNQKLIKSYIEDDFDIVMNVPIDPPVSGTDIGNGIKNYLVTETQIPDYNPRIQYLHGPFYNFDTGFAVQSFTPLDKKIEDVKGDMLGILAESRWKKEISGIVLNIQGNNIKITTNRGDRDIFLQALQSNVDGTSWKLQLETGENIWLNLSLSDLGNIVNGIKNHIQGSFDWERNKGDEINNATTLQQLANIVLE